MKELYHEFEIYFDYPNVWFATHLDYDGPDDSRHFWAKTKEKVMEMVDEYWEEQHPTAYLFRP